MFQHIGALWHHRDFLKLWTGETVSLFGSQITLLALPLTAVLVLKATPLQMGILGAAGFAPFLVLTLFAGVWIDHHSKRIIMLIANLGQALVLGLVPLCAFLGLLRIEYLYAIAFVVGVLGVFFQLAYQSFLPTLVVTDQLVEGNSKLNVSESLAAIGGPGLAGVLLQVITAPLAILLDVFSFLISAFMLLLIRKPESMPTMPRGQRNIWSEINEGLRMTFSNTYLRAVAGEAATYNFFWSMIETIYVLYIVRELHIQPGMIGLLFAIGSLGSLLGALMVEPLARRFKLGSTMLGSMILSSFAPLAIPFAHGPTAGFFVLALAAFVSGIGITVANVHVISLRQTVTPEYLLGRMNASYRFLTYGVLPVGYLLGGLLGDKIGLRPTLFIGVVGLMIAWLWVMFSPVARLSRLPVVQSTSQIATTQIVSSEEKQAEASCA